MINSNRGTHPKISSFPKHVMQKESEYQHASERYHIQCYVTSVRSYSALINRAAQRYVWENFNRGREYKPNAERFVHTSEVKILSFRPTKLGK